jgi:hypothetical protein
MQKAVELIGLSPRFQVDFQMKSSEARETGRGEGEHEGTGNTRGIMIEDAISSRIQEAVTKWCCRIPHASVCQNLHIIAMNNVFFCIICFFNKIIEVIMH